MGAHGEGVNTVCTPSERRAQAEHYKETRYIHMHTLSQIPGLGAVTEYTICSARAVEELHDLLSQMN